MSPLSPHHNPYHVSIREELRAEIYAARWCEHLFTDRLRKLDAIEGAIETAWAQIKKHDLETELALKADLDLGGRIHTAVRLARDTISDLDHRIGLHGGWGSEATEDMCQDAERALIALRALAREYGAEIHDAEPAS